MARNTAAGQHKIWTILYVLNAIFNSHTVILYAVRRTKDKGVSGQLYVENK